MAILASWDGTTTPDLNITSGSFSLETGGPTGNYGLIDPDGDQGFARWTWPQASEYAVGMLYLTPAAWESGSKMVFTMGTTGAGPRVVLSGTGGPGQLRIARAGGATVAETPQGAVSQSTWYWVELQYRETGGQAARMRLTNMAGSVLYESDWTASTFATNQTQIRIGGSEGSNPIEEFGFTALSVLDTASEWQPSPVVIPPEGVTLSVWDGSAEVPVAGGLTYWDGTSEQAVADLTVS